MNLHSIVSPYIGAVNPPALIGVQVSVGYAKAADYSRTSAYATPGAVTASIGGVFEASASANMLTVSSAVEGILSPGDVVSGTDGLNVLPPNTVILQQLSGATGGAGVYELNQAATLNPCAVTAASSVLNVTAVAGGVLQVGQTLADQGTLAANTVISGLLTGAGGVGTYSLNRQQTVAPETMTTFATLLAQVQPLSTRDLRQIDGLNLQGDLKSLYINGPINGIVRPAVKGGDLVTLSDGSVWLVTMIPEGWNFSSGWTKAIIVLQNDEAIGVNSQTDAQPLGAP